MRCVTGPVRCVIRKSGAHSGQRAVGALHDVAAFGIVGDHGFCPADLRRKAGDGLFTEFAGDTANRLVSPVAMGCSTGGVEAGELKVKIQPIELAGRDGEERGRLDMGAEPALEGGTQGLSLRKQLLDLAGAPNKRHCIRAGITFSASATSSAQNLDCSKMRAR
ncbi:hypothetical protein ABRA89_00905 [Fulvimarina sp. MAC8]